MRLDQLVQLVPRRCAVDLSEEVVASRQPLLGGVFEIGESSLNDRLASGDVPLLSQVGPIGETPGGE
jgi:hypothetical protein